jgi:hypothetical protein
MSCNCNNNLTLFSGLQGNPGNYTVVTAEPVGVNCTNGGVKIELFNGLTNALISTEYACNGICGCEALISNTTAGDERGEIPLNNVSFGQQGAALGVWYSLFDLDNVRFAALKQTIVDAGTYRISFEARLEPQDAISQMVFALSINNAVITAPWGAFTSSFSAIGVNAIDSVEPIVFRSHSFLSSFGANNIFEIKLKNIAGDFFIDGASTFKVIVEKIL